MSKSEQPIMLVVIFNKKKGDMVELEVKGWDLKDNGDLYIVESDKQVRVVAAGVWAEVISTRKAGS